ncbi:hypothetical protein LTR56_018941 [Elasticomyces elasticus]|nr:hypothetical protein LTR56_018941 [Elasticomyces elasticus]KAK3649880.1 hypothetical protein LTR22_012756 [Elasticomyces elasticus]KAK4918169.1 hypothetical protein LTR49_014025 [Elasticomyces elasticus]KAK5757715.1 hypothetical protein LTS12_012174 [Elasticomyces elasticus]
MPSTKRALRVAGASGGFTDRQRAILSLAKCDVDVIVGDWMSECTMSWHGAAKADFAKKGISDEERAGLYDPSFMANITPALSLLQEKGIKLAVNAGASDTEKLAKVVVEAVKEQGLNLKVAWIEGDEVMDAVNKLVANGEKLENICFGGDLKDWGFEPLAAQCYLGGAGIAEALRQGADIVICGRVADAAPTVGASMWWHGWDRESDFDRVAGALMAGHLIECSSYVCGGYYSGFKDLFDGCENVGFPIAQIERDGSFYMEKEANTGGEISVGTCASQLLYEIQGPQYYGSDVVALLEGIKMTQVEKDKVYVEGIKGKPPPTTTKVGITASGGWQAEFHYLLCGLDLEQKAEWTERQVRASMGKNAERFSCLKFSLNGYCPDDPRNQDVATADFRVFVQTKDRSLVVRDTMEVPGFNRWCMENFLQSCPGATIENDIRQSAGKEFFEYWAALLPQEEVAHKVNLMWAQKAIDIAVPKSVQEYGYKREERQWSYETKNAVALDSFGPTTRGPLGWVVLGRSGDKASDANIGFFVRQEDEYQWLCSLLTIPKMKQLLGPEYNGKGVDRFEIPGIKAVHFLLHDHLDRSYNASSTYDGLGKNVCEYLRAKHVEIPNKFLRRGRV